MYKSCDNCRVTCQRLYKVFITDPLFYLVAIPAVVINGLGKGGLGSAMGVIGVPLMALVISPVQAAAIILPLLLAMDLFAMWGYRNSIDRNTLNIILVPGLTGVVLGGLLVSYLPENALRVMVGIIAVVFSFQYALSRFIPVHKKPGILAGRFWATIAGFTSFSVHAGGAPISVYLLPQRIDKKRLAGTLAIFFGCVNFSKVIAYSLLGEFDLTNLSTSLILFPLVPVGVWLGMKLVQKINDVIFYRIMYMGLFMTGCKLLWDGLMTQV